MRSAAALGWRRADTWGDEVGDLLGAAHDDEILVRVTPTKYVGAFGVSD